MGKVCIIQGKDLSAEAVQAIAECTAQLAKLEVDVRAHTDEELGSSDERKVIHDLKEAIMTMEHALKDIAGGYRFNDDFAEEKRKAITRSVEELTGATNRLITWIRD